LDVSRALALLVLLVLTPVGCGAERDGGQSPVTTVEAPVETVEIETQGRDELHGPDEDDADDDGEEDDEDKGKARGHDKKKED
jgi:hypothetical protein